MTEKRGRGQPKLEPTPDQRSRVKLMKALNTRGPDLQDDHQPADRETRGPDDAGGNATAGSRAVGGDCRICLKQSHQLFRLLDLRLDKFLRKHLARPSRVERKGVKKRCLSP
jgi:hypothetical protein